MDASSNRSGIRLKTALIALIALIAARALHAQSPNPTPALAPTAIEASGTAQPEGASGRQAKPIVRAREFLAVTAHPLASEAAYSVLEAGGSAVDAAIAAQAVLALVEPQSSGVGGGGFLLHHDPLTGQVHAYDGRETAPAGARPDRFVNAAGQPLGFVAAVVGGRSVGVPGLIRMLELAHRDHGALPWKPLFDAAIQHAQEGFAVSPRLHTLLARDRWLRDDDEARALFYGAHGEPLPIGARLRNPALAEVLGAIAQGGARTLHEGPIASDIARRVRGHPSNPGDLGEDDLRTYQALRRAPVCSAYRQWLVCGMPPPSAGAISVAQILALHRHGFGGATDTTDPVLKVHRFTEAGRLAFADRDRWIADPEFAHVPAKALLDPRYLGARAALIGPSSMGMAPPGDPERFLAESPPKFAFEGETESTTHLTIVDAKGRTVVLTSSIEQAFGSRVMVRGFLLNNQLTDFSFQANLASGLHPNRVQGGKRPRSSMAPTLVFGPAPGASPHPEPERDAASPAHSPAFAAPPAIATHVGARPMVLAIGSPGGPAIINYVARALIGVLDEGQPLQQVINAPNLGSRNGPTELEPDDSLAAIGDSLAARGHRIVTTPMTSGLHGITRRCLNSGEDCILESGTDPRREGLARGR